MFEGLLWAAGLLYLLGLVRAGFSPRLRRSAYPSPSDAEAELRALAEAHPERCRIEEIGRSSEGRPLLALRLAAPLGGRAGERPRLLVTGHIHAVEYVGAYVARAVARRLLEGYGRDAEATGLLESAEVWICAGLNPDGAERVWRRGGYGGVGQARFTARGVDPNRNFPFRPSPGPSAWNSGRNRPGSAYYRGPEPLSEPECRALAELCARERFCGAVHFHSFGCVVFVPTLEVGADPRLRDALDVFQGEFQSRQPRIRYRPVPERSAAGVGQLDPFLVGAFGTPSVTVEVSRPSWRVLKPGCIGNVFWVANPERPERWAENDAAATVHALVALLERSGGRPATPTAPELAAGVAVLAQ